MSFTKLDLLNTLKRSELAGESLKLIHATGAINDDGSWSGGFILARDDGTFAVIEGWTGPKGWADDALCGYDLMECKSLDDAFALADKDEVFEIITSAKETWEPGKKEDDDAISSEIGTKTADTAADTDGVGAVDTAARPK